MFTVTFADLPRCEVMSLIKDEDDGAAEPLCTQSDDEHNNYLKAKAVRYSDKKRIRFIWSFVVICYLVFVGMYVKLWKRLKELESEVLAMEPDLFPCMDSMVSL